jgi:hypothetical protein
MEWNPLFFRPTFRYQQQQQQLPRSDQIKSEAVRYRLGLKAE